jgi:hypothetical protein
MTWQAIHTSVSVCRLPVGAPDRLGASKTVIKPDRPTTPNGPYRCDGKVLPTPGLLRFPWQAGRIGSDRFVLMKWSLTNPPSVRYQSEFAVPGWEAPYRAQRNETQAFAATLLTKRYVPADGPEYALASAMTTKSAPQLRPFATLPPTPAPTLLREVAPELGVVFVAVGLAVDAVDDEGAAPLCATDDCDWLVTQARAPAMSRATTAARIQLRRDGPRRAGLDAGPAGGTGRAGGAERTGGAGG